MTTRTHHFSSMAMLLCLGAAFIVYQATGFDFLLRHIDTAPYAMTAAEFTLSVFSYSWPLALGLGAAAGCHHYTTHAALSAPCAEHYIAALTTAGLGVIGMLTVFFTLPAIAASLSLGPALLTVCLPCVVIVKAAKALYIKLTAKRPRRRSFLWQQPQPSSKLAEAFNGVFTNGFQGLVSLLLPALFSAVMFMLTQPGSCDLALRFANLLQDGDNFFRQASFVAMGASSVASPFLTFFFAYLGWFAYTSLAKELYPQVMYTAPWWMGLILSLLLFTPLGFVFFFANYTGFVAAIIVALVMPYISLFLAYYGTPWFFLLLSTAKTPSEKREMLKKISTALDIIRIWGTALFVLGVVLYSLAQLIIM